MQKSLSLPKDLPVPIDDGASNHLLGSRLPEVALASTDGVEVNLGKISGRAVLYCYPMTGKPGTALPEGWAMIPGAMGCTPEACEFRDRIEAFNDLGVAVYGISIQTTVDQKEARARLHLPFVLLSDKDLEFAGALKLPTFEAGGKTILKRLTMVVDGGRIVKVFYPVFPPDRHPEEVVAWLRSNKS